MLRLLDLFSGIGGFSYAAERLVGGYQTVQFVESEHFCRRVLRKHWNHVPIHHDVCTFKPRLGMADVITAGFPCQDVSIAGKKKGIGAETRSGLVSHVYRIAEIVKPSYIVLENVPRLINHGLDQILSDLASLGFDSEWAVCGCSHVGGFHKRERVWVVAYSISHGGKRHLQQALPWEPALQRIESLGGFKKLRTGPSAGTPKLLRGTDGLPNKLDRLHALGNAVVPAVAAIPLARVADLESSRAGPPLLAQMLSFKGCARSR